MAASIASQGETLEGQLQEILISMQNLEGDLDLNPDNTSYVTGTVNTDNMTFSGTFNLPVKAVVSPVNGRVTYVAKPVLNSPEAPATEPAEG